MFCGCSFVVTNTDWSFRNFCRLRGHCSVWNGSGSTDVTLVGVLLLHSWEYCCLHSWEYCCYILKWEVWVSERYESYCILSNITESTFLCFLPCYLFWIQPQAMLAEQLLCCPSWRRSVGGHGYDDDKGGRRLGCRVGWVLLFYQEG